MEQLTPQSLQKLPPHNLDAERAVLCAILLDNTALLTVMEYADSSDFYRPNHVQIFEAMLSLQDRGIVIDLLTLCEELQRREVLDTAGGIAYITELSDVLPTAANVKYHAQLLHEKAQSRRLLTLSLNVATRCYADTEHATDLLGDAEQGLFDIAEAETSAGFVPIQPIIRQSYAQLETQAEHPSRVTGLSSGFLDLDSLTSGFQPSDLIILAARPAMGKTSFCLNVAQHLAIREQTTTAIFSLEMSKEQLGTRLLCGEARVNAHTFRQGHVLPDDWDRLAQAADVFAQAPIFIDDTPGLSIRDLRAKAKRLQLQHGVGAVIVDYLQLMASHRRRENRQQEITEISRGLKIVAKELHVPVIALSQLSRALESRPNKRPQLSDLRESGAIEQDADMVLFLYRPEVYDDKAIPGDAELIIGKQRNGPIGTVPLVFQKEFTRFTNKAKDRPIEPESPFSSVS